MLETARHPSPPRFSVVIPTFHRPERLRTALLGLSAQTYPRSQFEVLVVNDGPSTESGRVVESLADRLAIRYLVLPTRRGPATARNVGALEAWGSMLAFLDDDCTPEPGWLSAFDGVATADAGEVMLGGRTVDSPTNSIYGRASQALVDGLYAWYNRDPGQAGFFATNNLACSRERFLEIGGFDETFARAAAEDRDFCDRWRERGWSLSYVPGATVSHSQRTSLKGFVRQQIGYGRGAVHLHRARDRRRVARPRLEPLAFYAHLLTMGARREPSRAVSHLLLACLSQVAYAYGYLSERWREAVRR